MQPKSNGAIRSNTKAMPVKMLDPDLEDVTDGVLESFDLSAFNPTFTSTRAVSIRPSSVSAAVTDFVKETQELSKLGTQYEIEVVQRGNEQLYELLASVYSLALRIEQHAQAQAVLEAIRKDYTESTGAELSKKATAMSIITRYVIRTDKSSATRYTQVLEVMKREDRAPQEIPAQIRSRGGLSAIQKSQAETVANKLSDSDRKARLKLMREYMTCMGIATKNGFSFEGSIQQFKAQDQTSNESASFTVFITLWDEASGQYKVVQGCDLGKSKEDQLLKILVEDSNRTPAEIERVVRSLQKRMLSLSHVSDATKDSYRKALSAAPKHGEEEPIDVQAEEKA